MPEDDTPFTGCGRKRRHLPRSYRD